MIDTVQNQFVADSYLQPMCLAVFIIIIYIYIYVLNKNHGRRQHKDGWIRFFLCFHQLRKGRRRLVICYVNCSLQKNLIMIVLFVITILLQSYQYKRGGV